MEESRLESRFDSEVLPYFLEQGKAGELGGVDGVPIHYRVFEHPDEKAALVISGGRTEFDFKYTELVYDLAHQHADAGFSVYIVDHRGQGFSGRILEDPEVGHVEKFSDYVDDFAKFMDEVVNRKPHAKRFLLAHSMGGAITTLYLLKHPEAFDAAAFNAPMYQVFPDEKTENMLHSVATRACKNGQAGDYVPGTGPYKDDLKFDNNDYTQSETRFRINRRLVAENPKAALGGPSYRWVQQSIEAVREIRGRAAELALPMLVLQAGKDKIVRPEGQDFVCHRAQRCTLKKYPDAFHEMLTELDRIRDPEIQEILTFFARN